MRRTLYVAGPMSGYPDHNRDAFMVAEVTLRKSGYQVRNPALNTGPLAWEGWMRLGLRQVLAVDGVAVLPGWEASAGACLEVHVAHQLRVPVMPVSVWVDSRPTA